MPDTQKSLNRQSAEARGQAFPRIPGQILVFLFLIGLTAVLGFVEPVRLFFGMENMEKIATRLGMFGPIAIVAFGLVAPFIFVPRWPLSYVSGLLYGVSWGVALSLLSASLGAWLHFTLAKGLLAKTADGLLQKPRLAKMATYKRNPFILVLLLRLFPLSNFSATNLLSGALRIPTASYLLATVLGMLPTTVVYVSWGKATKEPSPYFVTFALSVMLALISATYIGKRIFEKRGGGLLEEGTPQTDK